MRAACAVCAVLAVFGTYRSIRHAKAIHAYTRGVTAFRNGDYPKAAENLDMAINWMPEDANFQDLGAYYRGYECYSNRDAKGALLWFQKSLKFNPESPETALMVCLAQRKVAFEAKDYEGYFRASEALVEADNHSAESVQAMAPAWACRYVISGNAEYRLKALACLKEARELGVSEEEDASWVESWVNLMLNRKIILSFQDYWYSIGKGSQDSETFG